jgi:hypothetical protein
MPACCILLSHAYTPATHPARGQSSLPAPQLGEAGQAELQATSGRSPRQTACGRAHGIVAYPWLRPRLQDLGEQPSPVNASASCHLRWHPPRPVEVRALPAPARLAAVVGGGISAILREQVGRTRGGLRSVRATECRSRCHLPGAPATPRLHGHPSCPARPNLGVLCQSAWSGLANWRATVGLQGALPAGTGRDHLLPPLRTPEPCKGG